MSTTPTIIPVETWLTVNDPRNVEHTNRVMLAANLAAADSDVKWTGSKAMIGGPNLAPHLAADKALATLKADPATADTTSDAYKALVDKFIQSPLNGCTTVMDMAMKKSGFNPLDPAQVGNDTKFQAYISQLISAPFFHLESSNTKIMDERSSNWDGLIGGVADLFKGITDQDKGKIIDSLKALAHAATATSDTVETTNLFVQSAIGVDSDIAVNIYWSNVGMIQHSGKHSTDQTTFKVVNATLNFRTDQWPGFAPKVAAYQVGLVSDWLTSNNTPNNTPS